MRLRMKEKLSVHVTEPKEQEQERGQREDEQEKESSPPKSPPPFSKAESRFEREQRIKVGSLDSYTPGNTLPRQKRYHHCPWLQEDDLMLVLLSASVLLQSSLEPSKLTRESGSEWSPGE